MKAHTFGPLVLTTVRQSIGAPILDGCTTAEGDRRFGGLALRVRPRGTVALALVAGWEGRPTPNPRRWARAPRWLVE